MATTNKVKGWTGVLITEDSSSHWPIKRRYVYSETSRRAGLEFVCIFGHDALEEQLEPSRRIGKVRLQDLHCREDAHDVVFFGAGVWMRGIRFSSMARLSSAISPMTTAFSRSSRSSSSLDIDTICACRWALGASV